MVIWTAAFNKADKCPAGKVSYMALKKKSHNFIQAYTLYGLFPFGSLPTMSCFPTQKKRCLFSSTLRNREWSWRKWTLWETKSVEEREGDLTASEAKSGVTTCETKREHNLQLSGHSLKKVGWHSGDEVIREKQRDKGGVMAREQQSRNEGRMVYIKDIKEDWDRQIGFSGERGHQQIGFRQKWHTDVYAATHAEGILGEDMKGQYLWMICMVGEEKYLKGEMGNTGNLKMRPEILKKGETFKPL